MEQLRIDLDALTGEQDVLDEDQETARDAQFAAAFLGGQVVFQDGFEFHPFQEVIDDGKSADGPGAQRE